MLNLTPLKQTKNYCGPFSVKMVLAYYGIDKDPEEIATLIKATHEAGCDPIDIVQGLAQIGLKAVYKKESSIDEIKAYLAQNIPVIVQWFSPEANGHYTPVVGFEGDDIVLADSLFGELRRLPVDQFILKWFELDHYPPQNPANFTLRDIVVILPPTSKET